MSRSNPASSSTDLRIWLTLKYLQLSRIYSQHAAGIFTGGVDWSVWNVQDEIKVERYNQPQMSQALERVFARHGEVELVYGGEEMGGGIKINCVQTGEGSTRQKVVKHVIVVTSSQPNPSDQATEINEASRNQLPKPAPAYISDWNFGASLFSKPNPSLAHDRRRQAKTKLQQESDHNDNALFAPAPALEPNPEAAPEEVKFRTKIVQRRAVGLPTTPSPATEDVLAPSKPETEPENQVVKDDEGEMEATSKDEDGEDFVHVEQEEPEEDFVLVDKIRLA